MRRNRPRVGAEGGDNMTEPIKIKVEMTDLDKAIVSNMKLEVEIEE